MGRRPAFTRLQVGMNGRSEGRLTQAGAELEFVYDERWVAAKEATPISLSLPLRQAPHRGAKVAAFFDNLLPDNEVIRRRIAERFALERPRTLDILSAVGRDCVGAIQFLPEGETFLHFARRPGAQLLKESQIADLLRNLTSVPLGLGKKDGDFRISIAGAQEKTGLLQKKGRWYLPLGPTPTTHILKPPLGDLGNGIDLTESVENEWLCLKLAGFLGLPVAEASIVRFKEQKALSVARFDRKKKGAGWLRIPQEDLCQALAVPWTRKYQAEGGPGIREIMTFLHSSDSPAEDRDQFMRSCLVFFLLAAIDGHAKNFSIRITRGGFRLTPLYDVMSAYPAMGKKGLHHRKTKLAMSVGKANHYGLAEIRFRHWEQTARACGYPLRSLKATIESLAASVVGIDVFCKQVRGQVPDRLLESVVKGVQEQARRLVEF